MCLFLKQISLKYWRKEAGFQTDWNPDPLVECFAIWATTTTKTCNYLFSIILDQENTGIVLSRERERENLFQPEIGKPDLNADDFASAAATSIYLQNNPSLKKAPGLFIEKLFHV